MNSHTGFCRWLVMDWAELRGQWARSNETPERFLLVTRDGRGWLPDLPSPLSLPKEGFVLVSFSNDDDHLLSEKNFDVDKLFGEPRSDLPIWCHYGGAIRLEDLANRWRELDMLDEAARVKLTKLLLAPYSYPMPISMSGSQQLDWNSQWDVIKSRIVSYEPAGWDELSVRLNQAWNMATNKISGIAAKSSAKAWVNAAHVFGRLRALLGSNKEQSEQLIKERVARALKEAKDSQLNRLRPKIAEGLDSSNLSIKFDAVLNAVDVLSVSVGQEPIKKHANSLRELLKEFEDTYQDAVAD
jgi:hypothetical protein